MIFEDVVEVLEVFVIVVDVVVVFVDEGFFV